jgi:arylsulfatase A-like enzyme
MRNGIIFGVAVLVGILSRDEATAAGSRRPNFVIIMADDMGYSDLGCMGSEIRTPNIDKLAADGILFRHCYNNAKCSPTRASLLTGLYPHQTDVGIRVGQAKDGHYVDHAQVGSPGHRGDMNHRCVTIAEALRASGYATYLSGKWHVTRYVRGPKHNWPLQRGFDRFFGTLWGCGDYHKPKTLTRDNEPEPTGDDFYYTDEISRNASLFIRKHVAAHPGKPFLLYVAYTAPHYPLMAPEEDVRRYEGTYDAGWDELRRTRYARMKSLGLIDPQWALSPRAKEVKAWSQLSPDSRRASSRMMAVYAAMVDRMDQGIGRIMSALDELELTKDTVIFFLSDNGATHEQGGSKYGPGWANACNTPYRRFKTTLYEGGIITPLIVRWPRGVSEAGLIISTPCQVMDIVPTCMELAGAAYPRRFNDHEVLTLEGVSLCPLLEGKPLPTRALQWRYMGRGAIREGKWKLIGGPKAWELYDMAADATELNDLARQHPKVARELAATWKRWERRTMPEE